MKNGDVVRQVKEAAHNKYAWPGGYPLLVLMSDGASMCCDCTRENFGRIGRATRDADKGGWAAHGVYIHWEGAPEICCHCNTEVPSAYGEPEPDQGAVQEAVQEAVQ